MVPVLSSLGVVAQNNEGSSDIMVIDDNIIRPQNSFKYTINWPIIEELIDFVKADLITTFLTDNTTKAHIQDKYDLAIPQPKFYENSKETHQDILR
jgi:hypothetical protein